MLIAHLWPVFQAHLHFNRKQREGFVQYLRTELLLVAFQVSDERWAKKIVEKILLGRKSIWFYYRKAQVEQVYVFKHWFLENKLKFIKGFK